MSASLLPTPSSEAEIEVEPGEPASDAPALSKRRDVMLSLWGWITRLEWLVVLLTANASSGFIWTRVATSSNAILA